MDGCHLRKKSRHYDTKNEIPFFFLFRSNKNYFVIANNISQNCTSDGNLIEEIFMEIFINSIFFCGKNIQNKVWGIIM